MLSSTPLQNSKAFDSLDRTTTRHVCPARWPSREEAWSKPIRWHLSFEIHKPQTQSDDAQCQTGIGKILSAGVGSAVASHSRVGVKQHVRSADRCPGHP